MSAGVWLSRYLRTKCHDFKRGTFTRLTSDRVVAYSVPTWSRDGRRVVFTTWFDGRVGVGSVAADASGTVEILVRGVGMRSYERTHPSLLPDVARHWHRRIRPVEAGAAVHVRGGDGEWSRSHYDVSSDGERFLFFGEPAAGDATSSAQLVLIQNWVDELKRLVP
jgi:Tol biopolymer transport system component